MNHLVKIKSRIYRRQHCWNLFQPWSFCNLMNSSLCDVWSWGRKIMVLCLAMFLSPIYLWTRGFLFNLILLNCFVWIFWMFSTNLHYCIWVLLSFVECFLSFDMLWALSIICVFQSSYGLIQFNFILSSNIKAVIFWPTNL